GCALYRRVRGIEPAPSVPAQVPAGDTRTSSDTSAAQSQTVTGEPVSDQPIIQPEIERRTIKRARIDTEDFEVGAYVGVLSIEDFESHAVYGARFAYHLTEDFFIEATAGQSRGGRTSYENLSG